MSYLIMGGLACMCFGAIITAIIIWLAVRTYDAVDFINYEEFNRSGREL